MRGDTKAEKTSAGDKNCTTGNAPPFRAQHCAPGKPDTRRINNQSPVRRIYAGSGSFVITISSWIIGTQGLGPEYQPKEHDRKNERGNKPCAYLQVCALFTWEACWRNWIRGGDWTLKNTAFLFMQNKNAEISAGSAFFWAGRVSARRNSTGSKTKVFICSTFEVVRFDFRLLVFKLKMS